MEYYSGTDLTEAIVWQETCEIIHRSFRNVSYLLLCIIAYHAGFCLKILPTSEHFHVSCVFCCRKPTKSCNCNEIAEYATCKDLLKLVIGPFYKRHYCKLRGSYAARKGLSKTKTKGCTSDTSLNYPESAGSHLYYITTNVPSVPGLILHFVL